MIIPGIVDVVYGLGLKIPGLGLGLDTCGLGFALVLGDMVLITSLVSANGTVSRLVLEDLRERAAV